MTPFELLAALYFAVLSIAAPAAPRRGRGVAYAGAVVALTIVAAIALPWYARAWLPHAYLLFGYWIPAAFVTTADPAFERWLMKADARLPRARPVRGQLAGHVLELAYLICYPLVPAGFAITFTYGSQDDVVRFWTTVLAAGYACYLSLPWAAARPPRLLPEGAPAAPARAVAAVNRAVLGRVSHQHVTFPSGHVAVSLAVALEVARVWPAAGAALVLVALLVAAAAVVGRYHYMVDVLAGVIVGVAAPALTTGVR